MWSIALKLGLCETFQLDLEDKTQPFVLHYSKNKFTVNHHVIYYFHQSWTKNSNSEKFPEKIIKRIQYDYYITSLYAFISYK